MPPSRNDGPLVHAGAERTQAPRVHLRNGRHGYGVVTKALHWLTVLALVAQFGVGYAMDFDEGLDRQEDQLKAEADRLEEAARPQGDAAREQVEGEIDRLDNALDAAKDDRASAVFSDVVTGQAFRDGLTLPELHVTLGLLVLVLAAARILWRRTTPLPPWAPHLSGRERRVAGLLEKVLLAMLVVVPASGLLLVAAGDGSLSVHVGAQVILLVAIAAHVGLVLSHTVVRRNRHLGRML